MMDNTINKDTVATDLAKKQQIEAIDAQIADLKRRQAIEGAGNRLGNFANTASNVFFQAGGIKPPEGTSDINKLIMEARIKRMIEGDPTEKYRREQTIKAEMEAQDPYKKSQLEINQEILKSIRSGSGGDLVYRDQLTGEEVPQQQALMDIANGKQYIIKRRITSRQGIKEEDVSKPKELTEAEVKTSTGAEEVLQEIGDLEKIIQAEPQERGASVPWLGKSAQAQGVKIPGIAPYGTSEKGQSYRTLRESINNRLLYLRSGAQINDKEYQRLSGMLPELFRSDKVDLEQLTRFKNEFGKILNRINSGRRGIPTGTAQPGSPEALPAGAGKITGFKIVGVRPSGGQ